MRCLYRFTYVASLNFQFFVHVPSKARDLVLCINNVNPLISGLQSQIRSSAWLEHYTDNVGVSSSNLLGSTLISCKPQATSSILKLEACSLELYNSGGLAQLARALALQARGHRFDPDILHKSIGNKQLAKVL